MLKPKWYEGLPDGDAVREHESYHPRPDGLRMPDISVDDAPNNPKYVKCDAESYGEWVAYQYKSKLQSHVSMLRLKWVDGDVLMGVGFCAWCRLADCRWVNECRYYPVGQDGLPVGFEAK